MCAHDFRVRRRGTTLLELVVALALVAALLAIVVPAWRGWLDRLAVRGAADDLVTLLATARVQAVAHGGALVALDGAAARAVVTAGGAEVARRALADGVRLDATRPTLAYDARGLGFGAANLRLIVWRGSAAETLYVSRLGRVRR